jgi:hypothetical protein
MESIAQWVIDNRYSKGEGQGISSHEIFHAINELEQDNKKIADAFDLYRRVAQEDAEGMRARFKVIEEDVIRKKSKINEWMKMATHNIALNDELEQQNKEMKALLKDAYCDQTRDCIDGKVLTYSTKTKEFKDVDCEWCKKREKLLNK